MQPRNTFDAHDLRFRLLLKEELRLKAEQGGNVARLRQAIEEEPGEMSRERCIAFFEELARLQVVHGERNEPSTYADIAAARPAGPRILRFSISHATLRSKLLGAWNGRCAGCLLGKPVEGWDPADIELMARRSSGYPLADYLGASYPPPLDQINPRFARLAVARFSTPGAPVVRDFLPGGMPRDDDTDYTVLNTLLLERTGPCFTTEDLADHWLACLPYRSVCTAETIAYRNLVNNIPPPACARFLNPGRELIGAQIRADAYGYIAPGLPEIAAAMAFKDACLSHVQNGIYGAMWVAAMLAAAFASNNIEEIIETGLAEVPAASRLACAVRRIVDAWRRNRSWKRTLAVLERHHGKRLLHEGHAVNNAAVVAIGLLEGGRDFERGITRTVMCGYDADCNGATVGSILGLLHGVEAIPEKWTRPFKDNLFTSIAGFNQVAISGMAERSLRLAVEALLRPPALADVVCNELRPAREWTYFWEMPRY